MTTYRPSASWLFVPGDRPERFDKAACSGAHEIIIDLEDSVGPERKRIARDHAATWLTSGCTGWVRVNPVGSPWHDADLAALAACPGLRGVMVPKSQGPATLTRVADSLPRHIGIVPLVETALGVHNAAAIAACPAVTVLAFGSIDYALDIDADETDQALLYARGALVVASRAAGLPAPIDGVTVRTTDTAAVRDAAARARGLGFGGKLCVHPAQIEAVNAAFTPSRTDVEWARTLLANAATRRDHHAFRMDGEMVDEPVLARARRILDRAGRLT
ncbi:CoA ester lyase [Phytohabitans sp. ZYX-F-186]|uniref:CoA ester lyase n=1 Tax=Phytohabitans maris TaxID=3071409 RepID=A0ABU0ZA24_9ACTN|nr:CoA ester lyase [Phytohabitans sp. ZYX-F-186]MDQ7903904.1 CoA ester lyase [Phytohabitans sp. ZYX-F-186]